VGDVEVTVGGQDFRGYRRGTTLGDPVDQYVIPVKDELTSFRGRAATFPTIGGAGTPAQQIMQTIFNAVSSTVVVRVNRVTLDLLTTVVKAATVVPPIVRLYRITALPSAGTANTKTALDTSMSSSASVTCLQGTASDGGALTAITATLPAGAFIAQKFAPRMLSAVGYEPVDTIPFLYGEPDCVLRAGQGLAVVLDNSTSSSNPATDFWASELDWDEFTRP
jgi:hypothetical protein